MEPIQRLKDLGLADGYVYDIEVKPNMFMATFKEVESGKRTYFCVHNDEDVQAIGKIPMQPIAYLPTFIKDKVLYGFNSYEYDDLVLQGILRQLANYGKVNNHWAYLSSSEYIGNRYANTGTATFNNAHIWKRSIDIRSIIASTQDDKSKKSSLKYLEFSNRLKHFNPGGTDYDKPIEASKLLKELRYNVDDVEATYYLMNRHKFVDMLEAVITIEKTYNYPKKRFWYLTGIKSQQLTERVIIDKIIEDDTRYYGAKQMKLNRPEYRELDFGKDVILPQISFKTDTFKRILQYFKDTKMYLVMNLDRYQNFEKQKFKLFKQNSNLYVQLDKLIINFGYGGLQGNWRPKLYNSNGNIAQSANIPIFIEANDDYTIIDSDVKSLYPNLRVNFDIAPQHISDTYSSIMKEWLEKKNISKGAARSMYKLLLVSEFGKTASRYSPLFDPKTLVQTTINGQLFMAMIVEELLLEGITIADISTDGITAFLKQNKVPKYMEILSRYEKEFNFTFEHVHYDQYYKDATNSYIAIYDDEVKTKGAKFMISNPDMMTNWSVIAKAVIEHIKTDIDVGEYIRNETDITEFLGFVQKHSNTHAYVINEFDERMAEDRFRVYHSTSDDALSLRGVPNKQAKATKPSKLANADNIKIVHILPDELPKDIDYDWYIERAMKHQENIDNFDIFMYTTDMSELLK